MTPINSNAAPPAFLLDLPERTTLELGEEISFVCHVECSPLCGLEWLVDGRPVGGEQEVGGDRWDRKEQWDQGDPWDHGDPLDRVDDFVVDLEKLEEDVEIGQFSSVTSILTWLNPNVEKTEFSVECRQGQFSRSFILCRGDDGEGSITSTTLVVIEREFSENLDFC